MLILITIWAAAAAYNSWRWWRVHNAQKQTLLPHYMSLPPAVSR
jgi:hypothetical protein